MSYEVALGVVAVAAGIPANWLKARNGKAQRKADWLHSSDRT
jgi:hypothetical protein